MAYSEFMAEINNSLNLRKKAHRFSLLSWLNRWGCRHFSKKYHKLASDEILKWYNNNERKLPPDNKSLLSLSNNEIKEIVYAYDQLKIRIASYRKLGKKKAKSPWSFGPTGAAKVLFAIRPESLIPWDEPIRNRFSYSGDKDSYFEFLQRVKHELEGILNQCKKLGKEFSELPKLLGRPHSFYPKLIDEYYWTTITNDCPCPSNKQLMDWIKWNK